MMVRSFFGILALAAAVAMPNSSWADDEKSDNEIARAILAALQEKQDHGELTGFQIGVSVAHGDVWLKGDVATREQQRLVLEIARHVPGVLQVVNDLKVIPSESTSPPGVEPRAEENVKPDENSQSSEPTPPSEEPQPGEVLPARTKPQPFVAPASADMTAAEGSDSAWQPRSKRIADRIVQSIESQREAGELTGFDVVVCLGFDNAVYLQGKVANEKTRGALLKIVSHEPEIDFVHDLTEVAEDETKLSDKVTARDSNVRTFRSGQQLPWDDDWWKSDFKTKKHR